METAALQNSDRLTSTDSAEALNNLIMDATTRGRVADPNTLNDQNVVTAVLSREDVDRLEAFNFAVNLDTACSSNAYAYQAPTYPGGYLNGAAKQTTYAKSWEDGSYGMHNEPPSLAFHGYGYSPQMHHKACAPVTSQLLSTRSHGHYNGQQFPSPTASYSQLQTPRSTPYVVSPAPASRSTFPADIDFQGDGRFLRSGYETPMGSSGRGFRYSGKSDQLSFSHQGLEDFEFGGLWSGLPKQLNGKSSLLEFPSEAESLNSFGSLEKYGKDFGKASQQNESFYGFGSCSDLAYRNYHHCQNGLGQGYESVSTSSLGNWPTIVEARQRGRCNDFSCSCTVALDTISERNRGPRAFKPKNQTTPTASPVNSFMNDAVHEAYNRLDFVTDYNDAKFFVIKSYSEDNVHKSIKYGVWASTPNGNKKLDAAYREAKEKEVKCPIFLLFSVNASAQFCGVAEMAGPVDFDKNVDYWLQDKWSGQFPVRWHIIKDVPNSHFRHILLENNDNKPVTNSRDTQEVALKLGIEILNIFKNYEMHSSILDDFHFYEERQKAMQERKAKQQTSQVATHAAAAASVFSEQQNPALLSNDFIKKMSKSFAEAVVLNEDVKDVSAMAASRGRGR